MSSASPHGSSGVSGPASTSGNNVSGARLGVAAVLITVAIVAPLLVFFYAREDPALGGIPFFFWFQFALIPLAALATSVSYLLVTTRRERTVNSAPPAPSDSVERSAR